VKGASNIWSAGDCSTIEQPRLLHRLVELFKEGDVNNDGFLNIQELEQLINKSIVKYPHLEQFSKKVTELFKEADVNKDNQLSLDEFKGLVMKVDSKMKMLPATAQVASQEGIHLGHSLNRLARGLPLKPFRYRHMGAYAYIGDETAVAELPFQQAVLSGFGAWWLWRSVYLSKQVSIRNKIQVGFDWTKTAVFGRDITRN